MFVSRLILLLWTMGVGVTLSVPTRNAKASAGLVVPLSERLLPMHNLERARLRIPALAWDPALAAGADDYASVLATTNSWGHSPKAARPGQGENLWMGTRGAFGLEAMVGAWLSERSMFHAGVFPAVATSGNWADVGHYTQMISRRTTAVGCAIRANGQDEYLVCRYAPSGNVDGLRFP
jgi:Cysteine-rich secretory protein family